MYTEQEKEEEAAIAARVADATPLASQDQQQSPRSQHRAGGASGNGTANSSRQRTPSANRRSDDNGRDFTVAERATILSSAEHLKFYLWFGKPWLRGGAPITTEGVRALNLKPAAGNWYQHIVWGEPDATGKRPYDVCAGKWTAHQFAAFYWWRTCQWREKNGVRLTLALWDGRARARLYQEIKSLQHSSSPQQVFDYLSTLTHHFDFLRWKLGRIGDSLILDENTPGHRLVQPLVTQVCDWPQQRLDAEYEAYQKALEAKGY